MEQRCDNQDAKKGSLGDCNNWRGITLLSVPSKILCKIIVRRMTYAIEDALRKEKAGYRRECGCTDQIFIFRVISVQNGKTVIYQLY